MASMIARLAWALRGRPGARCAGAVSLATAGSTVATPTPAPDSGRLTPLLPRQRAARLRAPRLPAPLLWRSPCRLAPARRPVPTRALQHDGDDSAATAPR